MSDANADFNPFQAPLSQTADAAKVRLGDDDSFLVLKKRILCRDAVELPKVCVFYGETEDVEPRRKTLKTLMPSSWFIFIFMTFSVFVVPGLIFDSARGSAATSFETGLKLVVYLLLLGGGVAFIWMHGCYQVDVTWYLGKRYRRRAAIERRIGQVIVVAGAVGLLTCLPWVDLPFQVLFLGVIAAMLAGLRLNGEQNLQLSGRRHGAYILVGHRKKFFEVVTRQQNGF